MRVSLASSGGVWGRRGVPPAGPPEPGFSPPSQSNLMVPVLIGCPPGKRLAFDITYTLQYNRVQNKHYFDCVKVDPEMPCFLFRDSGCPAPSPLLSPALPACPLTAPTHPLLFLWVLSSLLLPLSHFSSRPPPLRPHSLLPILLDPRFGDGRFWQFSGQVKWGPSQRLTGVGWGQGTAGEGGGAARRKGGGRGEAGLQTAPSNLCSP